MSDVMGVSEQLKKKLIAGGYTNGRVIGSGCTMCGNPVRDMHLGGGKKKVTQKIIDDYIKGISIDYECELRTFDKSDDFCVYVKLKDEIYQSLIEDDDCEPTEEECAKREDEPEVCYEDRIIQLTVYKDYLLRVISNLSKDKSVKRIDVCSYCAGSYGLEIQIAEEV